MKVRALLQEVEAIKNPQPKGNLKDKLHMKLKDLFSVIEHYEESGEIKNSDLDKVDTFKKYVKHFIDEENRKNDVW